MITHFLKIEQIHLVRILQGDKLFEIRKNDRQFQVGDIITFLPLKSDVVDVYKFASEIPDFIITSIYFGYGLKTDYVVLGIKARAQDIKVNSQTATNSESAQIVARACP